MAAACAKDGEMSYADMEPEDHILAQLRERSDNQIASFEMLASALGACMKIGYNICALYCVL